MSLDIVQPPHYSV